jgi:hypothetical protein
MICGWYQATKRPSLVGAPAGKGVGGGVGVGVGGAVAEGATSVPVGGTEPKGEPNGSSAVGMGLAVGDEVGVFVVKPGVFVWP